MFLFVPSDTFAVEYIVYRLAKKTHHKKRVETMRASVFQVYVNWLN